MFIFLLYHLHELETIDFVVNHTFPIEAIEKYWGRGVLKDPKIQRNVWSLNFQRGGGFFCGGGMDILWNYAIPCNEHGR